MACLYDPLSRTPEMHVNVHILNCEEGSRLKHRNLPILGLVIQLHRGLLLAPDIVKPSELPIYFLMFFQEEERRNCVRA